MGRVEELMGDLVGPFQIRINHSPEVDTYLNVEVSLNGGKYVPLDLVGTGVLQILQIVSYVALFKPVFLLIDEPDNHLHPSRQALLSKAFGKIAKDYGATVIVSTHSRHLVASASADSKIIWMKDGLVESDDCRDLATVMMDLGALDQMDSRGARCIVCTEDKGKAALEKSIESLGASAFVKVISYNGISNAGSAVAIKAMCDLLPDTPVVLIHRDRDFLNEEELARWGLEYTNRGMRIFSPPFCDVEAYHCTAEHIAQTYEIDRARSARLLQDTIIQQQPTLRSKFRDKRREANQKFWRDGGGPATDDLWPPEQQPAFDQVYGKDLMSALNTRLAAELGGRRSLFSGPSTELTGLLELELQASGVVIGDEAA